ncbi:MAG: hypothetical protein HYZ22_14385 [Chloroflexi bacterium]|nr:hypothetical protein [Chloroflexota bacterium]
MKQAVEWSHGIISQPLPHSISLPCHSCITRRAILGVSINFQPAFYIHLILLHTSLALRVTADYVNRHTLHMWGGLLNEVAILLFIAITVLSIQKSLSTKV